MTQNFVMGFGGTGARCMEALAYLAASRSITEPLHMLVVDPDETNGNVVQCLDQLRRYQSIQQHVAPNRESGARPFFSTPLNADLGSESFLWANPQPNTAFQELIEYTAQPEDTRALLDLLFDESDLKLTFEKGYIGRAHIGSIDLLRTLETQIRTIASSSDDDRARPDAMRSFFSTLRAATQQPGGAHLLVVGSVFGGTGASGLPAIPSLLQSVLLSGLQKKLTIACIQVAPYFSFPQGRAEDPDSALHPLATQAALYHYSLTDVGYDRVYLVGAPTREESNSGNVVGGGAQRNVAHYVELAAGLAAAHFFAEPPDKETPEVFACGGLSVRWDSLPYQRATDVRKNLVALGTFCLLHAQFLAGSLDKRRHLETKWMSDLRSARGRELGGQERELRDLRDFAKRYLDWATEIQRISDVELFTLRELESVSALSSVAAGGRSREPYHELITNLNMTRDVDQNSGAGWYVDALTRATVDFCRSNYAAWWSRA